MAYSHDAVIQAQWQQLAAERAQATADYEAARASEDEYSTMAAAGRLLDSESKIAALNAVSAAYGQQQAQHAQQQRQNPFNLSKDEVDVSRTIGQGDPKLTDHDRQRIYSEQKSKLARMRATREYDDTQGRVFK
jgi:hypothetical protein